MIINDLTIETKYLDSLYNSISDHLCFTGAHSKNTHDLLPIPYTEESLNHIVDKIKQIQDYLGRNLVLENPSSYLEFKNSEMLEYEFIEQMARRADCGILLDINNIYVTSFNHNLDAKKYIDAIDVIGNWFLECKYNPVYKYCKRRLLKEHAELFNKGEDP